MKYTPLRLVALLAPLVFSFAMGQDIFVPEVPKLINIFHTTPALVQLTLSLFMLAAGAGQLIIGPLADRFGRRSIVLFSIALYTLASVGAAMANSIVILILARIIEAIGACGMMACAFAVVRDLYKGDQSAQIYSYLNGAIAISPLLAPLLGGYLDVWFGWRAPFIALAVIGVIIFVFIFFLLDETIEKKNLEIRLTDVFHHYLRIIKNKQFLVFSFTSASALACFFTFFSVSPYILIKILHIPETKFGLYFAIIGLMFFIGSVIAGKLNVKIGINNVALLGNLLLLTGGMSMLLWSLFLNTNLLSFLVPMAICAIGGAFMMGAGAGGALEPFADIAGTAAALYGMIEFAFSTLVSSITLLWPIRSNIPLAIVLTTFGILTVIFILPYRYTQAR